MSRRDTILAAVLINTILLALLFVIAINPEGELMIEPFEKPVLALETPPKVEKVETPQHITFTKSVVEDEIDRALQDYAEKLTLVKEAEPVKAEEPKDQFINITVKRGDMLERIARANGTTVSKLKQLNRLADEKIEVGQVLRVPIVQNREEKEKQELELKEEFYIIKNGDNPWKIAKQFNVRFDELLILNHLDEEKARKLKAGDKIRVH